MGVCERCCFRFDWEYALHCMAWTARLASMLWSVYVLDRGSDRVALTGQGDTRAWLGLFCTWSDTEYMAGFWGKACCICFA